MSRRRDRWQPSLKVCVLRTKPLPRGARPRRQDPCGERLYGSRAGGSSPPKMQGEASLGGGRLFPVTQVTLGMTRGALPLSPQDTHPVDNVGGPRRSRCKGAPNTEPRLLSGSPPVPPRECSALLLCLWLGLSLPLPSPVFFFSQFFIYKMETKRIVISQT